MTCVPRVSECELEVDTLAADILNQHQHQISQSKFVVF